MFNVLCLSTGELVLGMSPASREEAVKWLDHYRNEFPDMEYELLDHAPGYPYWFLGDEKRDGSNG